MQVQILGSAAGGGFPQWNCDCPNCHAVRGGQFQGKARSQTQVAVRSDDGPWFLFGASPDLRSQIESSPELHPGMGRRSSPISGVVLASADLDHVLGLLLLRELQPLRVCAAESVIKILRDENSMFRMLNRIPGLVKWQTIRAGESFTLQSLTGDGSAIDCRAVAAGTARYGYAGGPADRGGRGGGAGSINAATLSARIFRRAKAKAGDCAGAGDQAAAIGAG